MKASDSQDFGSASNEGLCRPASDSKHDGRSIPCFLPRSPICSRRDSHFSMEKRCHEKDCITGMSGSMVDRLIAWCQVNLCCNPWRWSNQMPACFPCPNKLAIFHPLAQRSKGPRPRTSSGPIGWWKQGENCSLKETRRTEQQPSFSFKKDPKISQDEQINRSETQVLFGGLFDMTGKAFKSVLR